MKLKLLNLLFEGVYDPGILKCIFLGGGPGSGKSYAVKEIFGIGTDTLLTFTSFGLKLVNVDIAFEKYATEGGIDLKDLFRIEKEDPEAWHAINFAEDSPFQRAKRVTKSIKKQYEQGRLGLILDGTSSDVSAVKEKLQVAEALGYDCFMVFVNTSLETALSRNKKRTRTLPDELVAKLWKECQESLNMYRKIFGDKLIIVNNEESDNSSRMYDAVRKHVNRFISSPVSNPIGKQWMADQLSRKDRTRVPKR